MRFGPYERPVQYYETDKMKIVHHSNYIRWYEEARLWYLNLIGVPYAKLEEYGILIPVLSVNLEYRKSFTYGDVFQVYLEPIKFNGVKCEFKYEVFNKSTGELCNTGSSSHCFVNLEMKPFNMKRDYNDLYLALKKPLDDAQEERA